MALVLAVGCGGETPAPDVVLITIDTLRADHLGCYGYAKPTSPNIDALAAEGIRYDQCQAPAPITLPSHATILTGLLPPEHGVRNNGTYRLPEGIPTLAEVLRTQGYRTGAFVSAMPVTSRFGLDRGFEVYDDDLPGEGDSVFQLPSRAGAETVRAAGDWIDALGDEPVFVWVHLFEPHMPYAPPAPFDTQFAGAPYDGEVAAADAAVGELLRRLQGRPRPRVTMVTSDHGEGLGEHGEDTHAMFLYQTTLRVPLVVSGPGVPAGKVEEEPVGLVDVAPTLLELAGIDAQSALRPTGIALDPRSTPPRRAFYSESIYALETYQWSPLFALREGSSKVIASGRTRAFDLAADPHESDELADASWAVPMRTQIEGLVNGLRRHGANASRTPSADEEEALSSLGYVSSSPSEESDLLALAARLPDPTESLGDLRILQRAESDVARGRPSDAIAPLQALLSRTPDNVRAHAVLGRALAEAGQPETAREHYERAAALRPGWFEVLRNLARLSAMTGQTKEAARAYDQALAANGTSTPLWLEAAGLRQRQGDLDGAVAVLERALLERELEGGAGRIHDGLARLLLQADRVDEGRPHLAAAREAQPRDPRTVVLEALYLQREGRWQDMVTLLENPQGDLATTAEAWLYLGVAQQMLGRSTPALASFERALSLDASLPLAQNAVAWIYATEQDRAEEALPHARKAIQLQPDEPEFHDTYVEVLTRLGRDEEAKRHLSAILSRFPQHAGLRQRAERYGLSP